MRPISTCPDLPQRITDSYKKWAAGAEPIQAIRVNYLKYKKYTSIFSSILKKQRVISDRG